jgi:hypothetical protein
MAGRIATTHADGTLGATHRAPSGIEGIVTTSQQSNGVRSNDASGEGACGRAA